ncbi:MAG TPA: hypothetical protein VIX12_00155, partial [Candidatus Binataceae bacterium]
YGALSPLDRLAALAPMNNKRSFSRRTPLAAPEYSEWETQSLQLGSRLPINLRHFLAEQLGPAMRVDEDSIVALKPHSGDLLMRELARAIRRFSAERAREAWTECAIGLKHLEHEFFGSSIEECGPVVLCLRCACIGDGPLDQHCGEGCLAVDLGSSVKAERIADNHAAIPDALHRAVENFRRIRTAAAQSHSDLDCYVANGQVIFTWRPLPPR